MASTLNSEVAAALAPLLEAAAGTPVPPPGDGQTRRADGDAMVLALTGAWPSPPDVTVSQHQATAQDGATNPMRDEDLADDLQLTRAGVSVELHMYPDVPHSFELFAPESAITEQVQQDRTRFLRSL